MEAELVLPIRHQAQDRIVRERERFNVCAMGRRFGKTTLFLDLLLDDPSAHPSSGQPPGWGALDGWPVGWFAGSSKIFDETWRLMLKTLPPQIIKRTDSQKHRIELMTGGVIDFWSLDGGDAGGAGRGRKYRRVAVDEAAMVPGMLDVWSRAIRPTLVDLEGDAYFASTPRGIQNDFYDLWQRGQPGPKAMQGWKSWQMPSGSNPHLSAQELVGLKQEYAGRPLDYRQEVLAEFVADEGQVFRLEWIHESKPPERWSYLFAAWDLAVTDNDLERGDYSVGVVIGQDAMGRFWLVDLVRGRWNTAELTERMLALSVKYNTTRCWYEGGPIGRAIEPWLRRRMQETGRTFYFELCPHSGRGDKVVRTGPLVAAMANGSFYVPAGAKWLPVLRDELASFPAGRHDDQVDALSLAFLQLQAIRQSAPVPKADATLDPDRVTGAVLDSLQRNIAVETGRPTRRRIW